MQLAQTVFKDKHVLITGGLGFIGSTLARRLLAMQANVLLVDSLIPEYGGNLFNIQGVEHQLKVNISDVRDQYSFSNLIQGQDYVFNLAGQTSHLDSMLNPYIDLEINCHAQLSILETCRKHNPGVKIVFASTRQVYGKPQYLPVDENHPIRPVDTNGIHKVAGESYHLLYNNVYNIWTTVLRLTNTYGPRMRVKDARQTFLGVWLKALVKNEPFEVWHGAQLRDFNYVDDVVDALLVAAVSPQAEGKLYNIGAKPEISLKALADLLIEVNGGGTYIIKDFPEERKKIDIGDYYSDYKRIVSELGWEPKVSLEQGLKHSLAFYRQHIDYYL